MSAGDTPDILEACAIVRVPNEFPRFTSENVAFRA